MPSPPTCQCDSSSLPGSIPPCCEHLHKESSIPVNVDGCGRRQVPTFTVLSSASCRRVACLAWATRRARGDHAYSWFPWLSAHITWLNQDLWPVKQVLSHLLKLAFGGARRPQEQASSNKLHIWPHAQRPFLHEASLP